MNRIKLLKDFFSTFIKVFFMDIKKIKSLRLENYSVSGGVIFDATLSALSLPLALWLRVGDDLDAFDNGFILKHTLVYGLFVAAIFLAQRHSALQWRPVSMKHLVSFETSVSLAVLLYIPAMFLMSGDIRMPPSLIAILWGTNIIILMSSRMIYERIKNTRLKPQAEEQQEGISYIEK